MAINLIKLQRELLKINRRRQDIIRELENLDELKNKYNRYLKSPKLRSMNNIEVQIQISQSKLIQVHSV